MVLIYRKQNDIIWFPNKMHVYKIFYVTMYIFRNNYILYQYNCFEEIYEFYDLCTCSLKNIFVKLDDTATLLRIIVFYLTENSCKFLYDGEKFK